MSLETEHHGVKVGYNTDSDEWECRSMELKAKTLKALKVKMDKVLNVERRIDNLPIFTMGDGWGHNYRIIRGVATLFDNKKSYGGPQVWVNLIKGNQTERHKKAHDSVWRDTPENRERAEAIIAQNEVVRAETTKLQTMEKAFKAFTLTPLEVAGLKGKDEVAEEQV